MRFDVDTLKQLLAATKLPHNSMSFIHGGITACAITPELPSKIDEEVNRNEATRKVVAAFFNEKENGMPDIASAGKSLTPVFEFLNNLELDLIDAIQHDEFSPWFGNDNTGSPSPENIREWCTGFMVTATSSKLWTDTRNNLHADLQIPMFPILYHVSPEFFPPQKLKADIVEQLSNPTALIVESVRSLNIYWHTWEAAHRSDDETDQADASEAPIRRQSPKTGRNDPCPCGSGKKYKRCCGKDI
jgi:hypothetical protein